MRKIFRDYIYQTAADKYVADVGARGRRKRKPVGKPDKYIVIYPEKNCQSNGNENDELCCAGH
jgi:hypothetical protein